MTPSKERKLLAHVLQHGTKGDVASILAAFDSFPDRLMHLGEEKGVILDQIIVEVRPQHVLEIGTHCAYSSIRMGRHLTQQCRVISVEFNYKLIPIATEIVRLAGLENKVHIMRDRSEHALPKLTARRPFDCVFMDQYSPYYLRDIKAMEHHHLLRKGSVIIADNVMTHPQQLSDYREYMEGAERYTIEYKAVKTEGGKPLNDGLMIATMQQ